jgi:hypothetical protein
MLPESCPLICARCHVRLKGSGDPNDNATVFCPECGESDTLENAIREATEHFVDEQVHGMLGNSMRNSNVIQYIPNQHTGRISDSSASRSNMG